MVSAASSSSSYTPQVAVMRHRGRCDAKSRENGADALLKMAHLLPIDTPSHYSRLFSQIFKANPDLRVPFLQSPGGASNLLQRIRGDFSKTSDAWKKALKECGKSEKPADVTLGRLFLRNGMLSDIFMTLKNTRSIRLEECVFEPGAASFFKNVLMPYLPKLETVYVTGRVFREIARPGGASSSSNPNGICAMANFTRRVDAIKITRQFLQAEAEENRVIFQDILKSLVGSAENKGTLSWQSYLEREGVFEELMKESPELSADPDVNVALRLSINSGDTEIIKIEYPEPAPALKLPAAPAPLAQLVSPTEQPPAAAAESGWCVIA